MNSSERQIQAIKEQAIELWGDKWLPEIVRAYEKQTKSEPRSKFAQVMRYFKGQTVPNLDTMNDLLTAVDGTFEITFVTRKRAVL
jgi:hypothetical protein